jgi:hypothetical protein
VALATCCLDGIYSGQREGRVMRHAIVSATSALLRKRPLTHSSFSSTTRFASSFCCFSYAESSHVKSLTVNLLVSALDRVPAENRI